MSKQQNAEFEARLALAQADTIPVEILTQLAIDTEAQIRRAIVLNPNTPPEILLKLGEEFPNEETENPIFQLLLLENSDSDFVRLSLARSTTTDESTLLRLFETSNGIIRCAIAQNPKTPVFLLERFVRECNQGKNLATDYTTYCAVNRILIAIVQDPNTPESVLWEAVCLRRVELKTAMVQNPNTPSSVLEELATMLTYGSDLKALLDHPNVSATAIAIVKALRRPCGVPIPIEVLKRLVNHKDIYVRSRMINHSKLPLNLLLKLAEDLKLQSKFLQDYNTSVPVIERIAEVASSHLLSQTATNVEINEISSVMFRIARHHNTPIAILEKIALNQQDEFFQSFFKDSLADFRVNVTKNKSTPNQILRELLHDPESEVRVAAYQTLKARGEEV